MKKAQSFKSKVEKARGLLMADESTFRDVYDTAGIYSGKKITDAIIKDLVQMVIEHKKPTLEEIEKQGDCLAQKIFVIWRNASCLKELIDFVSQYGKLPEKFASYFDHIFRLEWSSLYIGIYKLIDQRKDVLSLPTFLSFCGQKALWKPIQGSEALKKAGTWRHKIEAHLDIELALNQASASEFYETMKLDLTSIESHLESFVNILNVAMSKNGSALGFHSLWNNPASIQLRELLETIRIHQPS